MKSGINRILLPVTVGSGALNAARLAFSLAKETGGTVTVLAIDDDSPWYETTLLPFHTKNLNPIVKMSEQSKIPIVNEQVKAFHVLVEDQVSFNQLIVEGHTATQLLLISRYHDIIVLPDDPHFADTQGIGPRRVNPLLEILDQTVVPVLLSGKSASPELGSAAIYYDGSPNATLALHQVAYLYQSIPEKEVIVRVSTFEKSIAQQLANDALSFLKAKGLTSVKTEYSTKAPIDFVRTRSKDNTSTAVLGIRSRQAFHDFRIGALAHHFLKDEPGMNKLFC